MFDTRSGLSILALLLVLSTPANAEDKCSVKALLGGKPMTMKHCIAAVYEDEHSVTLYFSDTPFTAKEVDSFHVSSYATDKNEAGKPRTMMHFAFCPGGGKPAASAAAVKSVETSVNSADDVMVSRQWVFHLPTDKESLKLEKLTGNIVPGGTISGRITGGKVSDGSKYSWEADFDFTLPAKAAAAGPGCGN
jgi:hypothetical protein